MKAAKDNDFKIKKVFWWRIERDSLLAGKLLAATVHRLCASLVSCLPIGAPARYQTLFCTAHFGQDETTGGFRNPGEKHGFLLSPGTVNASVTPPVHCCFLPRSTPTASTPRSA